jgi:very-short-patch-repair endonuclease
MKKRVHWSKCFADLARREEKRQQLEERRQLSHPAVSPEEDRLAIALTANGFNFRRQVKMTLGPLAEEAGVPYYRLDFLVEDKLVVEVDSYTHRHERKAWDSKRDSVLAKKGFPTIHVTNEEVTENLDGCVCWIETNLRSLFSLYRPI